jgi:hypothetical protein
MKPLQGLLGSSYYIEMIENLLQKLKVTENPFERDAILKEITQYKKDLELNNQQAKKAYSDVERRIARSERRRAKKEALQQFLKSDLYSMACFILGFDIKQKLKSIALYSKWITIRNHPTIDPSRFTMNHFTLDIEAYKDKSGKFIPYLLGIYNPELGYRSFYGENCLNNAINFILNHNYNNPEVTFYCHNGGAFDFLFLIKELNSHGIENIRLLKDKANSIFNISFEHNGYSFIFKDSFKLLPMSLDKLLKDFNIEVDGFTGKLPFNHSWVNAENLYYKGPTPDWLSHAEKELEIMGVIQNNEFSIKRYCLEYNKIDTIGLHKLVFKFFYTLVKEFKIDFSFCCTLPQLSMEIFRSKFLKGNKIIRLLSTQHHKFISEAYKGANVSVYKPYGENLYAYDVNSLYPYCM